MPGTKSTRERIRDLIDALPTTGRSGELADQILSLMPQSLPTWDQTQELINLAYQLGWTDRQNLPEDVLRPTVTIQHTPGKGITFLYDGKPRP